MLPGLTIPRVGFSGRAGLLATFATNTTSGTTSHACNKPAGTASGDMLIAVMGGQNSSVSTWTGDTGWTEIIDQGASPSLRCAWLVAGGSEPSSYTFTSSATTNAAIHIFRFSGAQYDADGGSVAALFGDGNLVATGITSAGGMLLAVYLSRLGPTTHSTPTGMTLVARSNAGGNQMLSSFLQNINAGATGTRTCAIGGGAGDWSAGFVIGVKPA